MLSCPRWVFLHEKAYQVRDTAIESSVVTKVKGFGLYANRVMDVSDYVTPPQVWSPIQRGMRMPRRWAGWRGESRAKSASGIPKAESMMSLIQRTSHPAAESCAGAWACGARHQESWVPLQALPQLVVQSRTTHTGEGDHVGGCKEPALPLTSPVTLAKSLNTSLAFLICREGISVIVPVSQTGTVAYFSLPSSPPKGTSVFVIITKMIVTENQMQGFCPEVRGGDREVG